MHFKRRLSMIIAASAATALTFSGCSGASRSAPSTELLPVAPRAGAQGNVRNAGSWRGWGSTKGALLYVSADGSLTVNSYDTKGRMQGQISGFQYPQGLAVDAAGNLYVADTLADAIDVFLPGAKMPSTILSDGTDGPLSVAVASDGTVYATNVTNGPPASISVWAPGSTNPTSHITDSSFFRFSGLALDDKGNLFTDWYASGTGGIAEVKAGSSTVTDLGVRGLTVPVGMAIGRKSQLLVADAVIGAVQVYPKKSTSPSRSLAGFSQPSELAFDAKQKLLYVSDAQAGDVVVLDFKSGDRKRLITAGLSASNYPWGVALNPAAPL